MEELRSGMSRKAPDGEARLAFDGGLRPASSVAARIEEYAEIFDGFSASCTIPVLELPPAIDGYGEAVGGYRSSGLDYSEIFAALDVGNFALPYEELVYMVNGLKEEEEKQDRSRVQEEAGFGQQEARASDLFAEEPNEGRTIFAELNQSILSSPLNCVTQQLNFSCGHTCQQRRVNELDCMICICQAHANFQRDFEAEIVSSIGFAENYSPKNIQSDYYRLTGDLKEEKAGKHGEVLDQCFISSIANGFENNLEDNKMSCRYPPSDCASENLKRYTRSSSYHSKLSGDIPFPDYTFVTLSDINLHTRPLQVPPPLRPPPKLDVKQGMTKSMAPQASNTVIDNGTLPKASKSYQVHHFGGPRTHHALKETLKNNSPAYFNVVDASRAAAASAAAMVEAMEQAQARLKNAKESRERMRDGLQCDKRFGSNYPWTQNGLNIDFSGGARHKTKGEQKVVPNHEEKVTTLFFVEEVEEAMHGKESGLYQLPHELEERSHEWKIEKQFYELVSIEKKFKLVQELPMREWDEKLMTSRVIDDANRNCIEEMKLGHQLNTYQCFSEKKCCGNNGRMFTCSNDDEVDENKGIFFEKSLNESILFSRGELHVQDGSAKAIKSGIMVDREEIIDILETYPMPYLLVEDEFKQKESCILQISNEGKTKLEDIVDVIQTGRNENELKKHHESHICSENERTAIFSTEAYVCEDNLDKLAQLHGGENVGEKLAQDKDSHGYTVSESCVLVESGSSKADVCMQHARKVDNSYETSLFSMNERLKEGNMASLHKASTVEVDLEYMASFSCGQEKNVEAITEECQLVKLQKTKRHTYVVSYNVGNDTELEGIDIASKQESRSFSEIYETCDPEENEKKGIHYQMAKLDLPNMNELKSSKVAVQQGCLVEVKKASEASEHWLKGEKQKMYELPGKSENHENRLNAGDEERKGENIFIAEVQAALELEKKIVGLSSGQQVFHRIRVKDREAVQQSTSSDSKCTILSSSIDASRSSLLPPMENNSDECIDTEEKMKEILDRERKQAVELQRKLAEQEREREREKDRTGVEKATRQACERAFSDAWERAEKIALERAVTEARYRPPAGCKDIAEKSSSEALEKSKATNEAKLRAERSAVECATTEVREGTIVRTLAEQASLEARRQTEAIPNFSKEKSGKSNEADAIIRPAEQENSVNNLKPTDVHDVPNDAKLQSAGGEGQSPLRCKARQERHQRIVDRVAKALAEKNMRDILVQREESERNRLADSLDVEVKRWSNGKEGNLRALLSTLQYILGPDSGWHPIPLTDVLTAAAVKKAYRKATLYVHPDKLQQRGVGIHHKYICGKVFDLLKDAWNKFNSEVR